MIASCLVKDPSKRPSASKLLKHSFFKQARSNDHIRRLLEGLPALGDRMEALKVPYHHHNFPPSLAHVMLYSIFISCFSFIEKRRRYARSKENA